MSLRTGIGVAAATGTDPRRTRRGIANWATWSASSSRSGIRTVLEVAAGTGWWTRRLAPRNRVIATDYAPEMIACARRLAGPSDAVERCRADAYRLPVAEGAVDACFFGFWLSHVPVSRAVEFMREV